MDTKQWDKEFSFIQGADPQFGFIHMVRNQSNGSQIIDNECDWEEDMKLAEKAVECVNNLRPKPKFFIICGDLTNEFPESNREIKDRQISDFKRIFGRVSPDIRLLHVCGNHDIGNSPTVESINLYRSTFGEDYYSFWCGGVLFIVLNSQYYKDPSNVKEFADKQEEWFDNLLATHKKERIICFSHIPWFVKNLDEPETIYNIPLETRKRMLEKIESAGIEFMFCGHCHENAGGKYKNLEVVITSAIGGAQVGAVSGLRIVQVKQDKVNHQFYGYSDFPSTISF